jgi:hypothetical protein
LSENYSPSRRYREITLGGKLRTKRYLEKLTPINRRREA